MALSNQEKARLTEIYEPILFFHKDEKYRPVHAGDLMERSAMWCNKPIDEDKRSWGNCSHTTSDPFPRSPLIDKGNPSVDPDDADPPKVFIGELDEMTSDSISLAMMSASSSCKHTKTSGFQLALMTSLFQE